MPHVPPLLVGLVDDAALLAPGSRAVETVAAHLRATAECSALRSDRLLVPAARATEVLAAVADAAPDHPVDVVLVAADVPAFPASTPDGGPGAGSGASAVADAVATVRAHPHARLVAVHVPLPADGGPTERVAAVTSAVGVLPARIAVHAIATADAAPTCGDALADAAVGLAVDLTTTAPADVVPLLEACVRYGLALAVTGDLPASRTVEHDAEHDAERPSEPSAERPAEPTPADAPVGVAQLLLAAVAAVESRPHARVAAVAAGAPVIADDDDAPVALAPGAALAATSDMLALQARDVVWSVAATESDTLVDALLAELTA